MTNRGIDHILNLVDMIAIAMEIYTLHDVVIIVQANLSQDFVFAR
jgi:hypothetical protein